MSGAISYNRAQQRRMITSYSTLLLDIFCYRIQSLNNLLTAVFSTLFVGLLLLPPRLRTATV